MPKTTLITGNTYPVKDQLKALGGRWNAAAKGWEVPEAQAAAAQALVVGAPAKSRVSAPAFAYARPARAFRPCGYPGCNPNYCDECDGEGYRGSSRY